MKRKSAFDGYKKEILSKNLRDKLQFVYNSTDNHIDLFAAGLAETPTNGKLVGPTFQYLRDTKDMKFVKGLGRKFYV